MTLNEDVLRFDEKGYVVLRDLLDKTEAAELYAAFDDLPPIPITTGSIKRTERAMLSDARFLNAITKPRLLDTVRAVLGDDMQLIAFDSLETLPGYGARRRWHADLDFRSDSVLATNVAIYLQDMQQAAGPLLVIPGTHRMPRAPNEDEEPRDLPGEIVVEVSAGSAVIFNAQLWHSGGRNQTDRARRALFPYFGHYWIKRMDEFYSRPLPRYVLEHPDPLVRQLFGLGLTVPSVHGEYNELTYG